MRLGFSGMIPVPTAHRSTSIDDGPLCGSKGRPVPTVIAVAAHVVR